MLGVFCSRDPIEYVGTRYSLYGYVAGRVVSVGDPFGLQEPVPRVPSPTSPPPPKFPRIHRPPPAHPGGALCRFAVTRVCLPVAVGYGSYKCGEWLSEYTTVPLCVKVVEWICSDSDPGPQPLPPLPRPEDLRRQDKEECTLIGSGGCNKKKGLKRCSYDCPRGPVEAPIKCGPGNWDPPCPGWDGSTVLL